VALFLGEKNLVNAKHFLNEIYVCKLAHLNDFFLGIQYMEHKYARECY
jgi:hypothetical protein